jgi:hypothetical protein
MENNWIRNEPVYSIAPASWYEEIVYKNVHEKYHERLRLMEKWLEEAEKRIYMLEKANSGWVYEWRQTRSAVLDELERWAKSTSFSPYMKEVIEDKLRSMREVKDEKE